jgi:hypothetical protein
MRTLPSPHHFQPSITMSQPPHLNLLSTGDRVILAIQAIQSNSSLTQRRAAHVFSVRESTLRNRRAGKASRRDSHPNPSRLKRDEEEAIVQYIKKLDARGFAPTLSYVREMANQLLAARSGGQVGENWAYRLVHRKPEIKSQITRQRDHQRVLCSNPAIISPWFNLVRNVKAKYGILDEDTGLSSVLWRSSSIGINQVEPRGHCVAAAPGLWWIQTPQKSQETTTQLTMVDASRLQPFAIMHLSTPLQCPACQEQLELRAQVLAISSPVRGMAGMHSYFLS